MEPLTLMSLGHHPPNGLISSIQFHCDVSEATQATRASLVFIWDQVQDDGSQNSAAIQRLDTLQLSSSTTDSSETSSLARKWIDDCLKNHSKCNSPTDGIWYPTRLLDSGPLGVKGHAIQLIETKATTPKGPYMTLSHIWGKGHSLKLTRDSYQGLLSGVSPSSLPRTFQEASSIARRLGVRYIWIDALCIFQDKDTLSDWNRESSLMQNVYANSICNIVAAEKPDSSHSMFNRRDPSRMMPPVAEVTLHGSRTCSETGVESFPIKYQVNIAGFRYQVDDAPINTRSWLMQERFMSPRGLHFGAQQLFWECREKDAAELDPNGLHKSHWESRCFKSNHVDMRDRPCKGSPGEKQKDRMVRHSNFRAMVSDYTACALTFPSDKLVAFSIIKQISTVFEEEYVAGMRSRNLEDKLLWKVDSALAIVQTIWTISPECRSGQGIRTPGVDAKYARLLAWCYKTRVPMIVAVPTILFWIFLINLLVRSRSTRLVSRDASS